MSEEFLAWQRPGAPGYTRQKLLLSKSKKKSGVQGVWHHIYGEECQRTSRKSEPSFRFTNDT